MNYLDICYLKYIYREWAILWFSIHNFESKDITGSKPLLYFIMIVNCNCTLKTSKKKDKEYLRKHFPCTILLNSSNRTRLNLWVKKLAELLGFPLTSLRRFAR